MAFVADNSVVLAWFVSSQSTAYSEKMLRRVAREPIHVPVVWSLEFANALRQLERRRKLKPDATADLHDSRRLATPRRRRKRAEHGIAPDEAAEGTNGLCFDTSLDFGPHSYARHVEHVRRLGRQPLSVQTSGLAFDLDLPQQLARITRGEEFQ